MMKHTAQVTTPSDLEIRLTRKFNAPRDMVFDCWTRPELVRRWMTGPPGWVFAICEIELRVGGGYRFVWRGPDGAEMAIRGVYREIAPPERLVDNQVFDEDWTGGETTATVVLTERDGQTTATTTIRYASKEARDGALRSGMEQGLGASYDHLDEVLAAIA